MFGCFKSRRPSHDNVRTANGNQATSSPVANVERIGIPECDEFVAKYETCIAEHVPEAKRREYRENLAAWSNAWRQQVVNTTAKEVVAAACKRHLVQSREAMKPFGCEF
jgi:hypothetical protein